MAGSRHITDEEFMYKSVRNALIMLYRLVGGRTIEIVSGRARGPDQFGERFATERGIPLKLFPADWKKRGKAAGPIRNRQMALYSDAAIIIWDGSSRGSRSMIDIALEEGLHAVVIRYP